MSASVWSSFGSAICNQNTTRFAPISGAFIANQATAILAQQTVRKAGTFSNFGVLLSVNTLSGNSVISLVKSGVNNASVTYASTETGLKEDTGTSTSYADGDTIYVTAVQAAGSGSMTARVFGAMFTPDDTTKCVLGLRSQPISSVSTASTSSYIKLASSSAGAGGVPQPSETDEKIKILNAATWSNLEVRVPGNARSTDSVYRNRINGADGSMLVTFAASETGTKEDVSNSDTLASGDDINYVVTTGTGVGSLQTSWMASTYAAANTIWPLICAAPEQLRLSVGTPTNYAPLAGTLFLAQTTEANAQFTPRLSFTLKNLQVYVSANALTGGDTALITSRINSADGNQSVTFGAAETGRKEDSSNTDTVTAGSTSIGTKHTLTGTGANVDLEWLVMLGEVSTATVITATESLAVQFSEFGVVVIPIPGSESLAVQLSEVGVMIPAYAAADSLAVQLSEQSVPQVRVTPTDAPTIALSESALPVVSVAPTDSAAVQLSESATILTAIAAVESLAVVLTESPFGNASASAADAVVLQLSETAALLVTAATADAVAVVLGEQALPSVLVATADTLKVQLAEAATALVDVPAADSLRIALTEAQAALLVIVAVADALGVTVGEAAAILVTLAASDSVAVVLTEVGAVQVSGAGTISIDVADSLRLAVSESVIVNGVMALAESLVIQTSESAAVLVLLAAADAVAVQLAEVGNVAVLLSASDATAVALSERALLAVQVSPSEALALGMTETAALFASVAASDGVVLVLAESVIVNGQVFATDATAIATSEGSIPLVTVAAIAEQLGVRVSEVAGIIENHVATESLAIAVVETQADLTYTDFGADPSGNVGGAGMRKEWIFQPRKIAIRQRWR